MKNPLRIRWFYLAVGTAAMLFAGIIYAWSILKAPFEGFGWSITSLSLNFTVTMSFFCLGGLVGARFAKGAGYRFAIILSGIWSAAGFLLTAFLQADMLLLLYLTYGALASLGIGIAYNVILSTVNPWFPDKKGLCAGVLMMGFGASALVLGNAASAMFTGPLGWRKTYMILGIALGVVLVAAGFLLKKPGQEDILPQPEAKKNQQAGQDMTSAQMLRRPSFYLAFLYLVFLTAVGSSVISFAKDLALNVGASVGLATTLVGVLSVCNGLGRILTGACFDALGCRKTMFIAAAVTVAAAGVTLVAVLTGSLWLCIAGLCLTGLSYGASPTTASAFTSSYYGTKYYPTNMAIMVFNMMGSSFVATLCGSLRSVSGGFTVPFIVLVSLAGAALVLNVFIRKP